MKPLIPSTIILASLLAASSVAIADTTINSMERFAYSANTGWINFLPDPGGVEGLVFGESFLSGKVYAASFGWIDFGDGTPSDQINYSNSSVEDFGVNHDGSGNLSGYAYGANIGWINFGWTAPSSSTKRPRVDLTTGEFIGYAYGANVGWINLETGFLTTDTMQGIDNDGDGIDDAWEFQHFGNLTAANATSNADGDQATDKDEYLANTDPKNNEEHLEILSHTFSPNLTKAGIRFTSKASRRYRLQSSTDLTTWIDSGNGIITPIGAATERTVTWSGSDRRFIRVIPLKPLQPGN